MKTVHLLIFDIPSENVVTALPLGGFGQGTPALFGGVQQKEETDVDTLHRTLTRQTNERLRVDEADLMPLKTHYVAASFALYYTTRCTLEQPREFGLYNAERSRFCLVSLPKIRDYLGVGLASRTTFGQAVLHNTQTQDALGKNEFLAPQSASLVALEAFYKQWFSRLLPHQIPARHRRKSQDTQDTP
ncbi:MAG: hypothetical protein ACFCBW_13860 [Candidatus Competibacterales bacterium]